MADAPQGHESKPQWVAPQPTMVGGSEQATTPPAPRRYKVVDAETGEEVSGHSFLLTPTGEEFRLLTKPGCHVGNRKDLGVYYTGDPYASDAPGGGGERNKRIIDAIVLQYIAQYQVIPQLERMALSPHNDKEPISIVRHLGEIERIAIKAKNKIRLEATNWPAPEYNG